MAAAKKTVEKVVEIKPYVEQPIKFRYEFKTWKEYWAYEGRKG